MNPEDDQNSSASEEVWPSIHVTGFLVVYMPERLQQMSNNGFSFSSPGQESRTPCK